MKKLEKKQIIKPRKFFPDLTFAVGSEDLRPAMKYAVVDKGRIVATDSFILACINLSIWLEPDTVGVLEGKAFDVNLLKKLAKPWKDVIFHKEHIMFIDKNGFCELNYYSGRMLKDGKIERYSPVEAQYFEVAGAFPSWESVVPLTEKKKIRFYEDPDTSEINLSLSLLNNASKCLTTKEISMKATGGKNRPYLLTPIKTFDYEHPEYSEFVMVMPIRPQ